MTMTMNFNVIKQLTMFDLVVKPKRMKRKGKRTKQKQKALAFQYLAMQSFVISHAFYNVKNTTAYEEKSTK